MALAVVGLVVGCTVGGAAIGCAVARWELLASVFQRPAPVDSTLAHSRRVHR